jgi:hypothetical protein
MENFWKWARNAAAIIAIGLFFKSWRENMESLYFFWNHLTPWQVLFFLVLCFAFFSVWRWKLRANETRSGTISNTRPIEVIHNPEGYQYLVDGDVCSHIPDPPTFNYLASLYGFTWGDSKLMLPDDIKTKYTIGKQLPSVLLHCPIPTKA